jgi:Fe-S cluster biogenesis protein NfuA
VTAPESTPGGDERAVAGTLVEQFDRMVRRDGGAVRLLGVDDGVIRVAYAPGADVSCETDACVLPHVELQQLMAETLARRDTGLRVAVELAD